MFRIIKINLFKLMQKNSPSYGWSCYKSCQPHLMETRPRGIGGGAAAAAGGGARPAPRAPRRRGPRAGATSACAAARSAALLY